MTEWASCRAVRASHALLGEYIAWPLAVAVLCCSCRAYLERASVAARHT